MQGECLIRKFTKQVTIKSMRDTVKTGLEGFTNEALKEVYSSTMRIVGHINKFCPLHIELLKRNLIKEHGSIISVEGVDLNSTAPYSRVPKTGESTEDFAKRTGMPFIETHRTTADGSEKHEEQPCFTSHVKMREKLIGIILRMRKGQLARLLDEINRYN